MLLFILLLPPVWCLISESFRPVDWLTGLVFGLLAGLASRWLLPATKPSVRLRPLPLVRFLLLAFYDMFPAAVRLVPQVLSGKAHSSESVIHVRLRHPLTRLLLCSAITMSPGTISARLQQDVLYILTLLPVGKPAAVTGAKTAERLQALLIRVEGGS